MREDISPQECHQMNRRACPELHYFLSFPKINSHWSPTMRKSIEWNIYTFRVKGQRSKLKFYKPFLLDPQLTRRQRKHYSDFHFEIVCRDWRGSLVPNLQGPSSSAEVLSSADHWSHIERLEFQKQVHCNFPILKLTDPITWISGKWS